jgi:hypothetical protein
MENVLPILLAIGLAVVMVHEWSSRPRTRAWRALRQMTNIPIAEVKDGARVRITGTVSALGSTMAAPIGQKPCIGFRLEIERLDRRGQPTVFRSEDCTAFTIADESGEATVEGPFLFGLDWEHDWTNLPSRWFGILERAGIGTEGLFFRRRFAYRQALLRPGDRVSACGVAFCEPEPAKPPVDLRSPALRPHLRGTKRDLIAIGDAGAAAGEVAAPGVPR